MTRLSFPLAKIKSHYGVVIVGSGYGGAVAASRLARAGQNVCVLERGKEFQTGEYPNTEMEVLRETQLDAPHGRFGSETGLYDFRVNSGINVFVGCGLGGGSLVNANVSLQPDPRVFEDCCWPEALRQDRDTLLREGYRLAEEMLQPTPYPDDWPSLNKLRSLEKSAASLDAKFYRPPINVTFRQNVNSAGIEQQACVLCGDCVTGCNHGAKNTVLMNYLPDARNHGAEIYTQLGVRRIEKKDGKWLVYCRVLDAGWDCGAAELVLTAGLVVLSAGTLGTTEILLRSRNEGLPLSDKIGCRFSGNGDVLGFSYNGEGPIAAVGFGHRSPQGREPVGPCITGIIDARGRPRLQDGIVIEEGSIPGAIGAFIPHAMAASAVLFGKSSNGGARGHLEETARELRSLVEGPYKGAVRNTQTYLVMGHDDGNGRLFLKHDRLRVHWPNVGSQAVFQRIDEQLHRVTLPLGGTYLQDPLWNELNHQALISVHPLGGCPLGETAEQGVVNHKGQVFLSVRGNDVYEDLYICDGSVVPRPLGVNPLLTITALAERCIALLAADRGWRMSYKSAPLRRPQSSQAPLGLRFNEKLKGFLSTAITEDFAWERVHPGFVSRHFEPLAHAGFERVQDPDEGTADQSYCELNLTVTSNDLETMIAGPDHRAQIAGNVTAPALSAAPLTVTSGEFHLFPREHGNTNEPLMRYAMMLAAKEGRTYTLEGFKSRQNVAVQSNIFNETTTLFVTVRSDDETASQPARVLARGTLRIEPRDLMLQLASLEITNASTRKQRLESVARFGKFFAGSLFHVYGGVFARAGELKADPEPRKLRPWRMPAPELHLFKAADGIPLRLIRHQGGTKGPVLLAPGLGTSTRIFSIDTIETNLAEFLCANDYDVWLFDCRASPELASSEAQFTIDDIATMDFPAAVQTIRDVTGAESVQTVAHCIGSMSFLMSLMAGLNGIRSAVCSSLGFFPSSPSIQRIQRGRNMGCFLSVLGYQQASPDFNCDNWKDHLIDTVLKLSPARRRDLCENPVCRQILAIYGEQYRHAQLNTATHEALHEMFGIASLRAFNHIALMVREGCIVDRNGEDTYLPNLDRLSIPISFLHGLDNRLFLPEGTLRAFKLLAESNDPRLYRRTLISNYSHTDLFIGKNAARDVFPEILSELQAHN